MKALILLSLLSAGLSGCASGLRRELQDSRLESARLQGYTDALQDRIKKLEADAAYRTAAHEFFSGWEAAEQERKEGGGQ